MKKKKIIISLGLGILFVLITFLVVINKTKIIDDSVYNFIISFRNKYLDNYFKLITTLGNTKNVLIVLVFFLIILKKEDGIILGGSALSCIIVNTIIKNIIRRDRPSVLRLIEQGGYSFPSGHAMISVCLYGALLYLVITKINNKYLKYLLSSILTIIIISIGISRIYVGVHYVSDIIAGYILSTLILIGVISLVNHLRGKNNDKSSHMRI